MAGLVATTAVNAAELQQSEEPEVAEKPLSAPDALSAQTMAFLRDVEVEDMYQRSETSRTFAQPDGLWRTEMFSGPNWVRVRGDGTRAEDWLEVDGNLVAIGDGLVPSVHPNVVWLTAGGVKSGVLARATDAETGVEITMEWPGPVPVAEYDGARAVYRGIEPGVDLVIEVTATGFEQFFVVHEKADAAAGFSSPLTFAAEGAEFEVSDAGGFSLVTPKGDVVATSSAPAAWDAKIDAHRGEPILDSVLPTPASERVPEWVSPPENGGSADADRDKTRVVELAGASEVVPGGLEVDLSVPDEWANAAELEYPIVVDPDVTLSQTFDALISTNWSSDQSASTELTIGSWDGGASKTRTFMNFNTSGIAGKDIVSATLKLYEYHSYSCSSRGWDLYSSSTTVSSSLRWSNQPTSGLVKRSSSTQTKGYSSSCPDGHVTISATNLVKYWAGLSGATRSLSLRAANESDSMSWKRFYSGNHSTSSYRPSLTYTYNRAPATPTALKVNGVVPVAGVPHYTNDTTPTLSATVTDPDGGQVKGLFTISGAVSDAAGSTVASGSASSYTPSTALLNGSSSSVSVKGNDARISSTAALAPTWTLVVDTTAPANATVSSVDATNGQWFTSTPAAVTLDFSAADAVKFEYALDGAVSVVPADGSGAATLAIPNPANGAHLVTVRAIDRAGNTSVTPATFSFGVGGAGISAPLDDAKSTAKFNVAASAPPSLTGTVTPSLYWRDAGAANGSGYDAVKGGTDGWTLVNSYAPIVAGNPATLSTTWDATDAAVALGKDRVIAVLDVQVCFTYSASANVVCTWNDDADTHRTVVRVPHAFGNNFPVASAGPGQVAMWTGEFNTAITDIEMPGYTGSLSVSRYYNTFAGATENGVFGPGWVPSFEGSDIGAAGLKVHDLTADFGVIALEDLDGSALLYRQPSQAQVPQELGVYAPLDDETAEAGAVLELYSDSGTLKLSLTEEIGAVTIWERIASGEWVQSEVVEPGNTGKTTYAHDSAGRITTIIAPTAPGLTCAPVLVAGCRVVSVQYATTTTATGGSLGDIEGQVASITYHAYNPEKSGGAGMDSQVVVAYEYDDLERLRKVTDERNDIAVTYEYNGVSDAGVPLLTEVVPGGLAPWFMEYADITGGGAALGTDALIKVSRGPATGSGSPVTMSRYVYNIDVTGATGGLPAMNSADVAIWGQTRVPVWGAATFGPDKDPGTSDPTAISAGDYEYANLSYTDAEGYTVNTADYGNSQWLTSAIEFDAAGRIVATWDADAIVALKGESALNGGNPVAADIAGSYASITRYNTAPVVASADLTLTSGTVIPAGTVLTPAGALITDTWAPAAEIDGHGLRRVHTQTLYDEGAPNGGVNPLTGVAFRLPTTSTDYDADGLSGSWLSSYTVPTGEAVLGQEISGYEPIDGAAPTSPTSGWMLGASTVSTTVMQNSAQNITSKSRYDELGRVLESRQPGSNGADAGTDLTVYYTGGANPDDAACGNRPEWAGQVCMTRSAESTPTVPEVRVTQYSMLLAPAVVTETLGAMTRTTTTTFLADGRADTSQTVVAGLAGSHPLPKAKTIYDATTALPTASLTLDGAGVEIDRISTISDEWGRNTSYTDTDGAITTNGFDSAGRLVSVTDPHHTVTYGFDGTDANGLKERRSLPTSMTVTGVGSFAAAYDLRGDMVYQSMPGGLEQITSTNRVGEPTGQSYQHNDGTTITPLLAWTQTHDLYGRVVAERTPAAQLAHNLVTEFSREYDYDWAGRLVEARDRTAGVGVGLDEDFSDLDGTPCVTRSYAFDVNGNRLSRSVATSGTDGVCTDSRGTSDAWTYDGADRLVTGANSTGAYAYDELGRQTVVPGIDTPGGAGLGDLHLSYYDNDLVHSLTQNGVTSTYSLDPVGRRADAVVSGGVNPRSLTRHYGDASDNPAWVTSTVGSATSLTWYGSSLGGDLGFEVTDGVTSIALADLHGDVATTIELDALGAIASVGAFADFDEYGRVLTAQPDTGAVTYGWLGSHERAVDDSGLLLMGVRAYNPVTGSFTSVDPVAGGNTTAYAYPQDPVNKFDIDGKAWGWLKKAVSVVTKVAEVASFIPGPIGMIASGVAVAGHLSQGNYKAAASAAVGLIPGGKLIATAAKVAKSVKVAKSSKKVVAACKNSFDAGTPVELGDGEAKPIEQVVVGDWVLATDPLTGATTAKPVTDLIRYLEPHEWVELELQGTAGPYVVDATAEHPFWVSGPPVPEGVPVASGGVWKDAGDLQVGDVLVTADGGTATVAATRGYEQTGWAYNLTVADYHTYYVGDEPVLVHNCGAVNPAKHSKTIHGGTVVRTYSKFTPAKKPGTMSGARYVREVNRVSGRSRGWMETYDRAGRVRQVHMKKPAGPYYMFSSVGRYIGRR